jgi:hypothetical protein
MARFDVSTTIKRPIEIGADDRPAFVSARTRWEKTCKVHADS